MLPAVHFVCLFPYIYGVFRELLFLSTAFIFLDPGIRILFLPRIPVLLIACFFLFSESVLPFHGSWPVILPAE